MQNVNMQQLETNPQMLEELLLQMFVPNTAQIKAAEGTIKKFTKNPGSIPALIQQLRQSSHAQARQLAGVLLEKKIGGHWESFNAQQKTDVCNFLIEAVSAEPERLVRHAIATVMAKVARLLWGVEGGQGWQQLLQFIGQCASQTNSEDHRELAFVILNELTPTIVEHILGQHLETIKALFMHALGDASSPKVQVAALKSSGALLAHLSIDMEGPAAIALRDIIPVSMKVAKECLDRGDEDNVQYALEVMMEVCQSPMRMVNPYIDPIIVFMLHIVARADLEMNTRDSASMVLAIIAEYKSKQLAKTGKIAEIFHCMAELIASQTDAAANALFTYEALADDDEEGDDDYDGSTPQSMAQTVLDAVAINLPPKKVFPPTIALCRSCFDHSNPHMRKAGVAVMAVVTEGCCELVTANLDQILPKILQAAVDAEPQVRECACFCLGQMSEHCQPDVLEYHASILPVAFQLLDDASDNVKAVSVYVLENFCENLDPETLRPVLPQLVQRLMQMLHSPKRSIQEMTVAGIAATAVAAELSFVPYLPSVGSMISQMLNITDAKMLRLRGRALECMGHIAIAVEASHFEPFIAPCMTSASEGLKIDDLELHEYTYTFFANLAKVLKEGMAIFLPELLPHLLAEVSQSDGGCFQPAPEEADAYGNFNDEDDDSDDQQYVFNVRTAGMDKRKAAMMAIGSIAEYVPAAFEPFLPQGLAALNANKDYWHGDMRAQVCEAAKSMVGVPVALYQPEPWVKATPTPLHPHTAQMSKEVITLLLEFMAEDTDKTVVTRALEGMQGVVETVGPMAAIPIMNELMKNILMLLKGESPCQDCDEDSEEEEEEEESGAGAEEDNMLEAIMDLLGALAKAVGPDFAVCFDQCLPYILKYTKGSRPAKERAMSIGACGEVIDELEGVGSKYVASLIPVAKKGLGDEDTRVRRNSAFCAGVLAARGGDACIPHYMSVLSSLAPIFEKGNRSGAEGGVHDNAAAAVARMISTAPHAVPMPQVLPAFLQALPLTSDMNENEAVYSCLLGLLHHKHPVALGMLTQILEICAKALTGVGVSGELQARMVQSLIASAQEIGDPMTQALEQVNPELKTVLVNKLSQGST